MPVRILQTLTAAICVIAASPVLAAAEKGGKEPSLFATDPFSYIWNLLMFLILLTVLWVFVWPKILQGLQARENKQREDLATAQAKAEEAQAAATQRQAELAAAQQDAQKLIEQAKTDAEQFAAKIKADAQSEIESMKNRAAAEIEAAKDQALDEVYAQTAELSTQIAGKILQREINADDQQQLVKDSLEALTKSGV